MIKKIKIKDLEDEPNLPRSEGKLDSQVMDWKEIDALPELERIENSKKVSNKSSEIKESLKKVVEKPVYFKRNLFISYFSKCFSVSLIFIALDIVSHLMKFFDGVKIFNFSNFQFWFLEGETNWVICKFLGFFIGVYLISTKEDIVATKNGLYCTKPEIMGSLFFTSKKVFIPWNQMSRVRLKMRLFEPYVFFYDGSNNKLGYLEFSLDSKDKFFSYIEKNAGENHSLTLIKDKSHLV